MFHRPRAQQSTSFPCASTARRRISGLPQSAVSKLREECFGLDSICDCLAVCFKYIDFGICEVVLLVVFDFSRRVWALARPKKQGRPLSRAAVWWILETVPHRFCEVVHRGTVPSHIGDVVISSGSRSSGLRRIFASDQLEGGKIWKHFGVVKIALSLSLE